MALSMGMTMPGFQASKESCAAPYGMGAKEPPPQRRLNENRQLGEHKEKGQKGEMDEAAATGLMASMTALQCCPSGKSVCDDFMPKVSLCHGGEEMTPGATVTFSPQDGPRPCS